jgi:hypothetical protein
MATIGPSAPLMRAQTKEAGFTGGATQNLGLSSVRQANNSATQSLAQIKEQASKLGAFLAGVNSEIQKQPAPTTDIAETTFKQKDRTELELLSRHELLTRGETLYALYKELAKKDTEAKKNPINIPNSDSDLLAEILKQKDPLHYGVSLIKSLQTITQHSKDNSQLGKIYSELRTINDLFGPALIKEAGFKNSTELYRAIHSAEREVRKAYGFFGIKKLWNETGITENETKLSSLITLKGAVQSPHFAIDSNYSGYGFTSEQSLSGLINSLLHHAISAMPRIEVSPDVISEIRTLLGSETKLSPDTAALSPKATISRALKEELYYPVIKNLRSQSEIEEYLPTAEALIATVIGSGITQGSSDFAEIRNTLPHDLRESLNTLLNSHNRDPLPEVSVLLAWALIAPECGTTTTALDSLARETQRFHLATQETDLDDNYKNPLIELTRENIIKKAQEISNLAPTGSTSGTYYSFSGRAETIEAPNLDFWMAIAKSPDVSFLLQEIQGSANNPEQNSSLNLLKDADRSLAQSTLSSLLVSQEHNQNTITLGHNLFKFNYPELLPFQVLNSFRELGHSGEMPFLLERDAPDGAGSMLTKRILALSIEELSKLSSDGPPGLFEIAMILKQHRSAATRVIDPKSESFDSYNPLRIELEQQLARLCVHYLQNGSPTEKQFSIAVLRGFRTGVPKEALAAVVNVLEQSQNRSLQKEALRLFQNTIPYSDSYPASVSELAIIHISKNAGGMPSKTKRAEMAMHALNLGSAELENPKVAEILCQEFNCDQQQLLAVNGFVAFLKENELISKASRVPSPYDSEKMYLSYLTMSHVADAQSNLIRLKQAGYKYNSNDSEFLSDLAKDPDQFFLDLETIKTDIATFDQKFSTYFEFNPSTVFVYKDPLGPAEDKAVQTADPYRFRQITDILSTPERALPFLSFLQEHYGEIPEQYIRVAALALSNSLHLPDNFISPEQLKTFQRNINLMLKCSNPQGIEFDPVLAKIYNSFLTRQMIFRDSLEPEFVKELASTITNACDSSADASRLCHFLFQKSAISQSGTGAIPSNPGQLKIICELSSKLIKANPVFVTNINEKGEVLNEAAKRAVDQALKTLASIAFVSDKDAIQAVEKFIAQKPESAMVVLRALPSSSAQAAVAFCKTETLTQLAEALPEHRDREAILQYGLPFINSLEPLTPNNVATLAEYLPLMLKRNAANSDCWSAYKNIISVQSDYQSQRGTLAEELNLLMRYNQHFPAMALPRVFQAMRLIDQPESKASLNAMGISEDGPAGINQLKERLAKLKTRLLSSEGVLEFESELDQDFLVALIGHSGNAYPLTNAVSIFNQAKRENLIEPINPLLSDQIIQVDCLDLQKVQAFEFSEPTHAKYQEFSRELHTIENINIGDLLKQESSATNTRLSKYVSSLEANIAKYSSESNEAKANKGREIELARAKKTQLDLAEATTPKEFISVLCNFRQRDNSITTPSLKRILFKLGLDEISDPSTLYRSLSVEPTKASVESLTALIQTNLLVEAIPQLKLDKANIKTCASALSVGAFIEDLTKLSQIDSLGKEEFLVHPTRGILAELSGYNCNACWTRETGIMQRYPNATALMIIKNPNTPAQRLVGACILLEAQDLEGNKILITRGVNPIQNTITTLDAGSFFENFIDSAVVKYAQAIGAKKIVVPAGEDSAGGAQTNRPSLHLHIEAKYGSQPMVAIDPNGPNSTFNGYNILNKCRVVREIKN